MYRKVLAVGSEDLSLGFALAGIESRPAANAAAAAEVLRSAVESGDYGIIIVDSFLMEQLDARMQTLLSKSTLPLVVTVPGEMRWRDTESVPKDDYVARLIRRAVGYRLAIKM